ncbi:ROK family transcriptional regulator [Pseudoflavonifractor gallinarum]|nr:ROK family transcriptional regulator [Oscillospiraceae bacterium]
MVAGKKVDRTLMHRNNTKLVLAAIRNAGEMSRAQAAEATGMSIVTVGRIVDELMARGVLREQEKENGNQVGRPPRVLSLERERLFCTSVCLEREYLHLGLVDPGGSLWAHEMEPVPEGEFTPEEILPWMAARLETFLEKHRNREMRSTIGVVVPGIVDIDRGELEFSANFRWRNVAVTQYLHSRLPGYEFVLENDTKAIALAEHHFGACAGSRSMVVLSIGDGIGAAVILNGEIYRGRENMAGEIGHIILNPAGKICECGKVGCLQTHLSQRTILAEARTVYPNIDMKGLFDYFQRGDPFAVALITQVVEYTSIAINLLANTYAPEVVLLCGSMLRQNPIFSTLVERNYRSKLNEYMQNTFQLRFESFGVSGHLIGGGALALRHVLDEMCQ